VPRKPRAKIKMKTHKGTAKRFKVTGSGKVMRMKGSRSHLRRHKSKRSKYLFSKMIQVTAKGYIRKVRRLAPNLWKQD